MRAFCADEGTMEVLREGSTPDRFSFAVVLQATQCADAALLAKAAEHRRARTVFSTVSYVAGTTGVIAFALLVYDLGTRYRTWRREKQASAPIR